MSAGKFKAKCLKVMDQVGTYGEVIVTKRGKPVAKLLPVKKTDTPPKSLFGCMKHLGPVIIRGDIVKSPKVHWNALHGSWGRLTVSKKAGRHGR